MFGYGMRDLRLFILDYWMYLMVGSFAVALLMLSLVFLEGERQYRVERLNDVHLTYTPPPPSPPERPTDPDYRWKRSLLPLPNMEEERVENPSLRIQSLPPISHQEPRQLPLEVQPPRDLTGPEN